MANRVQKKTALDSCLKNLAEMLEPHLVEIKHQGQSKHQHPEPLDHRRLFIPCYTEKTRRLPPLLATMTKSASSQ
jgi:hypothetical protein